MSSREAAPLGPEIHTTIKKILEPGEVSVPLVLEDRGEVVVIHLHAKTDDPVASAAVAQENFRRRNRRAVAERLELEILDRHDFALNGNR